MQEGSRRLYFVCMSLEGIVPVLQIKSSKLRKVKFAQDPTAVKRQAEFRLQNLFTTCVLLVDSQVRGGGCVDERLGH